MESYHELINELLRWVVKRPTIYDANKDVNFRYKTYPVYIYEHGLYQFNVNFIKELTLLEIREMLYHLVIYSRDPLDITKIQTVINMIESDMAHNKSLESNLLAEYSTLLIEHSKLKERFARAIAAIQSDLR